MGLCAHLPHHLSGFWCLVAAVTISASSCAHLSYCVWKPVFLKLLTTRSLLLCPFVLIFVRIPKTWSEIWMNAWFTVEHSTAFHFLHVGHLVESLCDSCLLLGVASLMKAERCSDLWAQQQSLEAILILCPFSRIIVLASSLGSRTQLSRVIFQNTNAMSVCLMIIYAEKWQNFFWKTRHSF